MKRSTNDKVAGKLHEIKGAIKAKVGVVTKNENLEAEGNAEKLTGKVQGVIGRVEKAVGK